MGKYVEYHKIVNFTSNGDLGISSDVIASITNEAINNVEGACVPEGHKNNVTVKYTKKGELLISCFVDVKFGYYVQDICDKVQERIEHDLLYMTEIKASKIDVEVNNILKDRK